MQEQTLFTFIMQKLYRYASCPVSLFDTHVGALPLGLSTTLRFLFVFYARSASPEILKRLLLLMHVLHPTSDAVPRL